MRVGVFLSQLADRRRPANPEEPRQTEGSLADARQTAILPDARVQRPAVNPLPTGRLWRGQERGWTGSVAHGFSATTFPSFHT